MSKSDSHRIVDIILPLERSQDEAAQRKALAQKLAVQPHEIGEFRLCKHSIDARKSAIKIQFRMEVALGSQARLSARPEWKKDYPKVVEGAPRVVIVGAGPAGLFAALRSLERGWKPIVLERGKDASSRRFDLRPILNEGTLDEESNYCFGEGGAGTFSDGKLYTRATKRGPVREVYETLVAHGAPEQILIDAHPHIGSNLLPKVVMAMRRSVESAGGEVRFSAKVSDFVVSGNRIESVVVNEEEDVFGDAVILATGHSARDIFIRLRELGIALEAKPFAVGVRIEHPQSLIDGIQYHHRDTSQKRHPFLPAAAYSLATKIRDRGVHSFCMCPGGFIVPAATRNDEVVVNGMSLSKRDSPFANSGLVVGVEPEDLSDWRADHGALSGVAFQRKLEILAKKHGGGGQGAPAQGVLDFLEAKESSDLAETSYRPGLQSARLDELLPRGIASRMQKALKQFGKKMPGYLFEGCNLIGFETRTSSPVRVPRDPDTLQHPEVDGLFPCGEGAGYAGGIVSAALDGLRCADQLGR